MSKSYKVNMELDVSKLHPTGGILMEQVDKEVDSRGFKERTGSEVFALIVNVAIQGANQKVSYDQLKGFRKTVEKVNEGVEKGSLEVNKTEIDLIVGSIKGNQWSNNGEIEGVLDSILENFKNAEEIV